MFQGRSPQSVSVPELMPRKGFAHRYREDALDQWIDDFRDILEVQARVFYSSIISGIDPAAIVAFDFAGTDAT